MGGTSAGLRPRHRVGTKLVTVEVPEIGEVKTTSAHARTTFTRSPEFQRLNIEAVDFTARIEAEREHGAVPDSGGLTIEWTKDCEMGRACLPINSAARVMLEYRSQPSRGQQGIIERLRLVEAV